MANVLEIRANLPWTNFARSMSPGEETLRGAAAIAAFAARAVWALSADQINRATSIRYLSIRLNSIAKIADHILSTLLYLSVDSSVLARISHGTIQHPLLRVEVLL
jgi:hypothetical protein